MLLSRSTGRKVLVTAAAAVAFASLYEVTTLDSRNVTRDLELRESTALPSPGARLRFSVTGYCKGTTTASGVNVRTGIAASDPELLPVGSVIQIDKLSDRYNGIYTIMDTGPAVQGRELDHLHVELQRGAGARPTRRRRHGRAAWLESEGKHAEAHRPAVPPERGAPPDPAPRGIRLPQVGRGLQAAPGLSDVGRGLGPPRLRCSVGLSAVGRGLQAPPPAAPVRGPPPPLTPPRAPPGPPPSWSLYWS